MSQYAMVLVEEQRIRLIFNDPILFKSGTDILTENSKSVLRGLTNIIKQVKNPIIIEGHTDDIPVKPKPGNRIKQIGISLILGFLCGQLFNESRR